MADALAMWRLGAAGLDQRVAEITADDWSAPTCCPDWDVRQLVGHAIDSQRFVPKALGASGGVDVTGEDLIEVWRAVCTSADQALSVAGAMDQVVTLPFGVMPVGAGLGFPTGDLLVHTWDLARAIGVDDRLNPDACAVVYESLVPLDGSLRAPGFFGPKLEPAPDADEQARLLAFVGRLA